MVGSKDCGYAGDGSSADDDEGLLGKEAGFTDGAATGCGGVCAEGESVLLIEADNGRLAEVVHHDGGLIFSWDFIGFDIDHGFAIVIGQDDLDH